MTAAEQLQHATNCPAPCPACLARDLEAKARTARAGAFADMALCARTASEHAMRSTSAALLALAAWAERQSHRAAIGLPLELWTDTGPAAPSQPKKPRARPGKSAAAAGAGYDKARGRWTFGGEDFATVAELLAARRGQVG